MIVTPSPYMRESEAGTMCQTPDPEWELRVRVWESGEDPKPPSHPKEQPKATTRAGGSTPHPILCQTCIALCLQAPRGALGHPHSPSPPYSTPQAPFTTTPNLSTPTHTSPLHPSHSIGTIPAATPRRERLGKGVGHLHLMPGFPLSLPHPQGGSGAGGVAGGGRGLR